MNIGVILKPCLAWLSVALALCYNTKGDGVAGATKYGFCGLPINFVRREKNDSCE
jgi:hypothetical protein